MHEVVQHVTSIEAVMAGWLPDDDATPPPFEKAAEFLAGSDDPAVLVDKVRAVYDSRRADLSALTAEDLRAPVVDAHRSRHLRAVPGDPGLRLLGARA